MDKCTYVFLAVVTCFMYIVATGFNSIAGDIGKETGIFKSSTGDISDKYFLNITPAGWTFSIWGVIYVWQPLWMIYALANICRSTKSGPAFNNPELMTMPFFILFTVNMALNLSWVLLFDREYLEVCLAILFLMYITLYGCLYCSYKALDENLGILQKSGRKVDIWLTRILLQNGITTYATWCTIATNLNLGLVLAYRSSADISVNTAGTIALGVISAQIVSFVVIDFFFTDRYTRYTLTPYVVIVFALIGSISKNYTEGARNTIFTIVLLTVASLVLIIKIILMIVRHVRNPIIGASNITDSTEEVKKQIV